METNHWAPLLEFHQSPPAEGGGVEFHKPGAEQRTEALWKGSRQSPNRGGGAALHAGWTPAEEEELASVAQRTKP